MKNFTIALSLIVFGAGLGIAWAAPARPLWTYHNGNTLQGHKAEYRRGYFIGVVDGYLQAQMQRDERGDDGLWLDKCLTSGWTLKRADRDIADRFENAVPAYANPAAAIVLDGLRKSCSGQ